MRAPQSAISGRSRAFCERTVNQILDDRARGDHAAVTRRWESINREIARQYVILLLIMLIDGAPCGLPAEHLVSTTRNPNLDEATWVVTQVDIRDLIHAHRRVLDARQGSESWRSVWPRVRENPDLPWALADLAIAAWLL